MGRELIGIARYRRGLRIRRISNRTDDRKYINQQCGKPLAESMSKLPGKITNLVAIL